MGTVKDDEEEEDASDGPHRIVGRSRDETDCRLKGNLITDRWLGSWRQGIGQDNTAAGWLRQSMEATTCSDEGNPQGLPSSFCARKNRKIPPSGPRLIQAHLIKFLKFVQIWPGGSGHGAEYIITRLLQILYSGVSQ